ncbi:MAG: trimethylamine methyltransferase family protein [Candidatus Hodarchaeales archaeon]|jgi:trimethylamine--corrinoid protein Co-methyltransferase
MFLKEQDIKIIIQAGFDILESCGAHVMQEEALEVFKKNNCKIEGNIVKIPQSVVEECIKSTPAKWTIYDREGNERLFMGEGKTYYGSADVATHFLDYKTDEVRDFTLNDSRLAAKLMEHLPNIDFVCPFGTPQDISQDITSANAFEATVTNTTKPIGFMTLDVKNHEAIMAMASIIRGGLDNLKKKPFILTLLESISPLTLASETSAKMLIMAENELPYFFASAPSLGATSPVTLAGSLAQAIAEALLGLVLTQLKKKGAPVGIGAAVGVIDMSTGVYSLGAPETALCDAAFTEIARYLNIPNWTTSVTQSKTPDQQAVIEPTLAILLNEIEGADVNWDIGYLESALITSFEELVLLDEIIGMVRRVNKGIEINDETLAKDLIINTGPRKSYLDLDHTVRNFRKELWFPTIKDNKPFEVWLAEGKLTMRDRAKNKIDKLLSSDKINELSSKIKSEINDVLASL